MFCLKAHRKKNLAFRLSTFVIALIFTTSLIVTPPKVQAQSILNLPVPGTMIAPSSAFTPPLITGITVHPNDPLQLDFIVDAGTNNAQGEEFEQEGKKLIRYFLAALTVPEDQLWVNLSPYEENRIIPEELGKTELGRDMLAQDYLLKQITASLMYPEKDVGNKFWNRVYRKAQEKFGSTEIPTNTFNKVWIVPDKAGVYVNGSSIFVTKSHLKVMLEEDYLALEHHDKGLDDADQFPLSEETKAVLREIIIPEIEREVNEGKNFAALRQIYNSMILAAWYKKNLKESFLGKSYVDKNKVNGIETDDKFVKEKIYNQYLEAFKLGVFDYIKEDYDIYTQEVIPRKYFSGGIRGVEQGLLEDVPFQDFRQANDDNDAAQMGEEERLRKFATKFRLVGSEREAASPPDIDLSSSVERKEPVVLRSESEIRSGLASGESGAFEEAIQYILVHQSTLLVGDISKILREDESNRDDHLRVLEGSLSDIFRLAISDSPFSRSAANILEGAAQAGSVPAVYALAQYYINNGNSDYIAQGVKANNEVVLSALAHYEDDLRAAISGGDSSRRSRALNVLPALATRGQAAGALGEAVLISDDYSIRSAFARLIYQRDEEALSFFVEKKDDIIRIAKSTSGSYRMASIIAEGVDALAEGSLEIAMEVEDAGLYYLLGRKVRESSSGYFSSVLSRDKERLGKIIADSYNTSLVRASQNLLMALAESGNEDVRQYVRSEIEQKNNRKFVAALRYIDSGRAEYIEDVIGFLDGILDIDGVAIREGDISNYLNQYRFSEAIAVLGQFGSQGHSSATALIEQHIPDIEHLVGNGAASNYILADIFNGLGSIAVNSPRAVQLINESYERRGVQNVLPTTRGGFSKVATVVIDEFKDGGEDAHGVVVEANIREAIGRSVSIPSYRIAFKDGYREKTAEEIQAELEALLRDHSDTVFVVNMSLMGRGDAEKVNGLLDFEALAQMGRDGRVVLTVAASNDAGANYFTYPDLDNLVVVGAVARTDGKIERASYTNIGPDITVSAVGHVGGVRGTSFSSPRINGLLARALHDDPNLPISVAIQELQSRAVPIEDPAYELGYLGAGVVEVEKELAARGDQPVTAPADIRAAMTDAETLLDALRESRITTDEVLTLTANGSYRSDPRYVVAEFGVQDPLFVPIILSGMQSDDPNIVRKSVEQTWVYAYPEAIPILERLAGSVEDKRSNPAYIIANKGMQDSVLIPVLVAGLTSGHQDVVNEIVEKSLWAYMDSRVTPSLIEIAGRETTRPKENPAYNVVRNGMQYPELVPMLVAGLNSGVEQVVGEIVEKAVWAYTEPSIIPLLVDIAGTKTGRYRQNPAYNVADKKMDAPELIPILVAGLSSGDQNVIHEIAREALWAYKDSRMMPLLINLARSESSNSYNPAYILADRGIEDPELISMLVAGLESGHQGVIYEIVREALWIYTDSRVTPFLVGLAGSEYSSSYNPASIVAGKGMEDPELIPVLVAGLSSGHQGVVRTVVQEALWAYTDPRMTPLLVELAKSEYSSSSNPAGIVAGKGMESPELIPIIAAGVSSGHQGVVREIVRKATWAYADQGIMPSIIGLARSERMYNSPIDAIGKSRDELNLEQLRPILEAGLESQDRTVNERSTELLAAITETPGEDVKKGGIDFDLRNIDLQEEGNQVKQFEFTDSTLVLNYDGLQIESISVEDFSLSELALQQ